MLYLIRKTGTKLTIEAFNAVLDQKNRNNMRLLIPYENINGVNKI